MQRSLCGRAGAQQMQTAVGRHARGVPPCMAKCSSRSSHRQHSRSSKQRRTGRCNLVVRAGPVEIDDEDLLQAKDRHKWYEAKFCAEDQPEWTIGRFLSIQQVAPDLKAVTVECEISRERVALRNAYKFVGQRAALRINSGLERQVTVASSPFAQALIRDPLFLVRGDLFAHEIKKVREPSSVMAPLTVLVNRKEAPELFNLGPDDVVEVGPFVGTGLDLRASPLMAIYQCPTVVMFVEGKGIATAKALIESSADVVNLNLKFRKDVRVYYKVPNQSSVCFEELFEEWAALVGVQVQTTTRSFQDAWDDDDTLVYDPETTGAIILTNGDEAAEKAALEVCKEAEITKILTDAKEQPPMVHLSGNPFEEWMKSPKHRVAVPPPPPADDEQAQEANGSRAGKDDDAAEPASKAQGENGTENGNGKAAVPAAGAAATGGRRARR